MKILFYASRVPNITVLLDDATRFSKEGHDVYFIYNNCSTNMCRTNLSQYSVECELCHRRMPKSIGLLPSSVRKINLREFWENSEHKFIYSSVQDIKKIEYKNVKVGYAAMSMYITETRNLNPLINDSSKKFFDRIISTTCRITDALDKAIDTIKPDRVCFFNSRFFDSRPALDLAKAKGIEAISLERTTIAGKKNVIQRFINTTPHDVKNLQKRCHRIWNDAALTQAQKVEIGTEFFVNRRLGKGTNDKVYIKNQQADLLPADWDSNKHNIVIFNSSEDEFASLGDDYEKMALFPTQFRGITHIMESLKNSPNVHVYLRIHPNLANIPYRYHTELEKLGEKYINLTIIPAADSISTYALMDASNKVIVFGSTMGVESVYWGKPVILLAGACYYYSDICYVPQTVTELDNLLCKDLQPKDNAEAIKWGFYFLYCPPEDYPKYIDIDSHLFYIGKYKFQDVHYLKLFGSSKLYAIYTQLLVRYYRRNASRGCEVPYEEDKSAIL